MSLHKPLRTWNLEGRNFQTSPFLQFLTDLQLVVGKLINPYTIYVPSLRIGSLNFKSWLPAMMCQPDEKHDAQSLFCHKLALVVSYFSETCKLASF